MLRVSRWFQWCIWYWLPEIVLEWVALVYGLLSHWLLCIIQVECLRWHLQSVMICWLPMKHSCLRLWSRLAVSKLCCVRHWWQLETKLPLLTIRSLVNFIVLFCLFHFGWCVNYYAAVKRVNRWYVISTEQMYNQESCSNVTWLKRKFV